MSFSESIFNTKQLILINFLNHFLKTNSYFQIIIDIFLFRFSTLEEWRAISDEIITIVYECMLDMPPITKKKLGACLKPILEQQFNFALGK